MLFSSITFLFYFLPIVLILYFVVPQKLKNAVLLIASLFFYAWGEPKYIVLISIEIVCGYIAGLLVEKSREKKVSKLILFISSMIFIGCLVYFKYADFFISNFNAITGLSMELLKLALPVGISFYTFQMLSYVIDVYRGDAKAQKNPINLALYVSLFPQLIAGPIVRYSDIAEQLSNRTHTLEKTYQGIRIFVIGLAKKVLIANSLGELCNAYNGRTESSVLFCWMFAIAYGLQIYFDFSGYSDMAIGLGKIFGFEFCKNFDYPYISGSITEFWRRWHMSLGTWFRDYVYIPLGGNRCSKPRWFFNIFVVWLLTGFWHGAAWNFIIWGLFFGVFLVIEKLLLLKKLEKMKVLNHIYVIILVAISFVIFANDNFSDALTCLSGMFFMGGLPLVSHEQLYYLLSFAVILIVAVIGATPLPKKIISKIENKNVGNLIISIAEPIFLVVVTVLSTAYLVDGSFNPFLYFRF